VANIGTFSYASSKEAHAVAEQKFT